MTSHVYPMRLDRDLTLSASQVAEKMSRSVPEQIAHWARIGRELERCPDVSVAAVRKVLEGAASYDELPPREQALARAAWLERMNQLREGLRLDLQYRAAGYRYAELDERGRVVVREPRARRAGRRPAASAKGRRPVASRSPS